MGSGTKNDFNRGSLSGAAVDAYVGSTWASDESLMYFVGNGIFLYSDKESAYGRVWSEDEDGGTWEMDGTTLILKWKDGTEDRTTFADNSFEVKSRQETFQEY